jgi:hypothetical protein
MKNLQRAGGSAALLEAMIYIAVFVFYGAVFDFPAGVSVEQKLDLLTRHRLMLSIVNLVGYVVFGILLAVIVLALHERLKPKGAALAQLASIFGLVWVGLVIASGMIANIGLGEVVKLAATAPEQAWSLWRAISTVVEGVGGGNEVVGGLWVLLISCAALRADVLPRNLNRLGFLVGSAGVLTIYPADVLTEIFGLGQIVWFAWLGSCMVRSDMKTGADR